MTALPSAVLAASPSGDRPPSAGPGAPNAATFDIREIRVTGVSIYPAQDIQSLTAPLTGHRASLGDLSAVAQAIEGKYRADGYLLAHAFVPPQTVTDGVFRVEVVEGAVAAIRIDGVAPSTTERIRAVLAPVLAARPPAESDIDHALLAANALPGVTVSGVLTPSAGQPGASDLLVTAHSPAVTAILSTDNGGAAATRRWTMGTGISVPSPLDDGGVLTANASAAPQVVERHALSVGYITPALLSGVNTGIGAAVSHGQPVGTIAALQIISDATSVNAYANTLLLLTRDNRISAEAGMTVNSSNVRSVFGSFSHDEWRVADLSLTFQNSGFLDGTSGGSLTLAQGIPSLGASSNGSPSSSRPSAGRVNFTKVGASLSRVQKIAGPLSLGLTGAGQYSFNPLLTGEEVSFGGLAIGRGYDPGAIIGDSGAGGSLELRYDIPPAPFCADSLQAYGFFDAAAIWLRNGHAGNSRVRSAGLGVRTIFLGNTSLNLEFAHVIDAMPTSDNDHHTSRVILRISQKF